MLKGKATARKMGTPVPLVPIVPLARVLALMALKALSAQGGKIFSALGFGGDL